MNDGNATNSILLFIGAFLASLMGVAVFRHWSLRREFFDIPNERSSHSTPTPRGVAAPPVSFITRNA